MDDRPLVSVICPTWNRHDLLLETIHHIQQQTYPNIEMVVVSDGPDRALRHKLWAAGNRPADLFTEGGRLSLSLYELGRNFSGAWPESFGVAPLTVGYLLAQGEYLMPWCDDERALVLDHVSKLVAHIEASGADFVYPKVRIWRVGQPDGPETDIVGSDPPQHGQNTHYMLRATTLRKGLPRMGTHPCDISLVQDWMAAGASWSMLDECTFSHRLDQ
jgi:cellulose synthase/poly-beta-1,6-N-acetylglucosamine synthase-like glycosyltransferase